MRNHPSSLMDDYKLDLCAQIQLNNVIWDPSHPDYKNMDVRKQVWQMIDIKIPPPRGVSSKEIWNQLSRGFCNALHRKKRRSTKGIPNDKAWKFEKSMSFLLPIKDQRKTKWNFDFFQPDENNESNYEDSYVDMSETTCKEEEHQSEDENIANGTFSTPTPTPIQTPLPPFCKQLGEDSHQRDDKPFQIPTSHQEEEKTESPRLLFFKSIMPEVDSMEDSKFLDFQIGVLTLLRNSKVDVNTHYAPVKDFTTTT